MDFQDLKTKTILLLECVSGSRAYGLATPQSDTDIKGVFLLPKRSYYSLETADQVSNATNDEVYYELKRFVELLLKNNPNLLELLSTPEDCILFRHPVMALLTPELFLSKLCQQTFAGYAKAQIKKAKGLNKKIVNPIDRERKSVLDFCYVIHEQGSINLRTWLDKRGLKQAHCGLVNIPHMREVYALFHNSQLTNGQLRGLCSGLDANDILLSSVAVGISPLAIMSFNKDGYSKYCKDYKEYWDWVEKRNDVRYANTVEHGKNYDTKNMMHTFRLLAMAEEIAREGKINVRRDDREFLLDIRAGKYEYEALVALADEKISLIDELYNNSQLPEIPNLDTVEDILIEIRESFFYNSY
jgi:hypothetical protein